MRFSPTFRRLLLLILAGVAISGLAWTWIDLAYGFGPVEDPAFQSAKAWLGRIHGAFAMLGLAALGAVAATHVPLSWKAQIHRGSGISVAVCALALALTGYLLYYAAEDLFRAVNSYAHIVAGMAACAAFGLHRCASATKRARIAAAMAPRMVARQPASRLNPPL